MSVFRIGSVNGFTRSPTPGILATLAIKSLITPRFDVMMDKTEVLPAAGSVSNTDFADSNWVAASLSFGKAASAVAASVIPPREPVKEVNQPDKSPPSFKASAEISGIAGTAGIAGIDGMVTSGTLGVTTTGALTAGAGTAGA